MSTLSLPLSSMAFCSRLMVTCAVGVGMAGERALLPWLLSQQLLPRWAQSSCW